MGRISEAWPALAPPGECSLESIFQNSILYRAAISYGRGTSYLPVIDLLKSYFAIMDRDSPGTVREKLTAKLLTMNFLQEGSLPALLSLLNMPVDDAPPRWRVPSRQKEHNMHSTAHARFVPAILSAAVPKT
jgi:hypothetical protein